MEYNIGAAIGAGLVGTWVMGAVLYMGIAMMPRQMTMNLLYMLGTMMTRNRVAAYTVGAMIHTVNGIVFALIHTGVYQGLLGLESGLAGLGPPLRLRPLAGGGSGHRHGRGDAPLDAQR